MITRRDFLVSATPALAGLPLVIPTPTGPSPAAKILLAYCEFVETDLKFIYVSIVEALNYEYYDFIVDCEITGKHQRLSLPKNKVGDFHEFLAELRSLTGCVTVATSYVENASCWINGEKDEYRSGFQYYFRKSDKKVVKSNFKFPHTEEIVC